jgi:uncharacterized protein
MPLTLTLLPDRYAVCRLDPSAGIPGWALVGELWAVTRTADELSVVTRENAVPQSVQSEDGWRALKLVGPFDFGLTGILASVLTPLAEAEVGIFAFSTFDTDYVLMKADKLDTAIAALKSAGHAVKE